LDIRKFFFVGSIQNCANNEKHEHEEIWAHQICFFEFFDGQLRHQEGHMCDIFLIVIRDIRPRSRKSGVTMGQLSDYDNATISNENALPLAPQVTRIYRHLYRELFWKADSHTAHHYYRHRRRRLREQGVGPGEWQTIPLVEPHTGKKRVLVTGGAGFIGSHVADFLLARGDDVIIVDEVNDYYDVNIKNGNLRMLREKYGDLRSSTNDPLSVDGSPSLVIYQGDICNATLVNDIFERHQPTWICHMAARAGVRPSIEDPFIYIHSNVEGTTRLLEISRSYGVQNFVFASSSSVYGGSTSAYFSEDELVDNPISPYAASKKACELIGYTYHHLYGMNVTGLRFFTVYGPRGRPDMAPFQFIDLVSRGKVMKQFGDGSSSRDYTYIDDIVDGVVRALDRPYPYQIFNLGKGSGTKLNDFISLVEKFTGNKAVIHQLPDQPGDVPYTCADVRKAERLLGYRSTVPFEVGIQRTVEWYQLAYPQNVHNHTTNTSALSSTSSNNAMIPEQSNASKFHHPIRMDVTNTTRMLDGDNLASVPLLGRSLWNRIGQNQQDQYTSFLISMLPHLQWGLLIAFLVYRCCKMLGSFRSGTTTSPINVWRRSPVRNSR
jgi:UDP-glucuronate 4-epimerase